MCRLFGIIAPEPTAAHFWLSNAPDSVLDQSYKNPDGTRLAYYEGGRAIVGKQPIAAYQDQEFASEARYFRSHLLVAHVRNATQGRASQENTQPFAHEELVFAHNGNVEGLEDLPVLSDSLYGDTDSERYFALLRYHMREAPDTIIGIRSIVSWISKNRDYTSLNCLLAN
jgi:glutamine amidotransferase